MANISSPISGSFPPVGAPASQPAPAARQTSNAPQHVFDGDAEAMKDAGLMPSPGKDRARGALEQKIGSAKEALGELVHDNKLAARGAEQRQAGLRQEDAGLRRDKTDGFTGAVDRGVRGVLDKITPDKEHDVYKI